MFVPPKTTFEELRQKSADRLEHLVKRHRKPSRKAGLTEGPEQTREITVFDLNTPKAELLRNTLEQVCLHATTQSQRDRYAATGGAVVWHSEYAFLTREVFWEKIGGVSGYKLVRNVWERFNSSRFGRFQRAFCYEHSAVAPKRIVEDAGKRWTREDRVAWRDHLNERPLSGVQVSPDLIPNRLATRLRLLNWPEETSAWEAIELKNTPAVVDGLKMIFESSVPLLDRNTRIWLLGAPTAMTKLRYPEAKIPHSSMEGTFIYFRGENATEPRPRARGGAGFPFQREIPSYFESVYSLYRATLYKSEQYEQEIVALSSLAQSAEGLNMRLATDWRKGASVELKTEMKGELEKLLDRATPVLVGMKHIAKREAGAILQAMKDTLAEIPKSSDAVVKNMRAVLPRIVALRNRLHDRGMDIPRKSRWNTEDQLQLKEYITKQEQVFKDLHQSLQRAGAVVDGHKDFFVSSKPLSSERTAAEAKEILQSLNLKRERLASVTARPLVTFAQAMNLVIGELEDSVNARSRLGTETAIVKLIVLSKLEQANACVERLKRFTAYCDVRFDSFEKASADLLEALAKREVFPARSVREYQDVYSPIQKTFTAMVKRFAQLKATSLTDDQRIVTYGKIRDFLDDPARDLEQVVACLVGIELRRKANGDGSEFDG